MSILDWHLILGPGEGNTITRPQMVFKADAAQTDGHYACMEGVMLPPGVAGPPRHLHRQTDEAFYILEGHVTFRLGSQTVHATSGSFVFVPRGMPHTFVNDGTEPSKALIILSPAGLEGYFEEIEALRQASPDGRIEPADLAALDAKYDLVWLPSKQEHGGAGVMSTA